MFIGLDVRSLLIGMALSALPFVLNYLLSKVLIPAWLKIMPNDKVESVTAAWVKKFDDWGNKKVGVADVDVVENTMLTSLDHALRGGIKGAGFNVIDYLQRMIDDEKSIAVGAVSSTPQPVVQP